MEKGCNPKCWKTATLHESGRRLMISTGGGKFPQGTPHPMCDECAQAEIEAAKEAIAFQGCDGLLEKFKRLKGKLD